MERQNLINEIISYFSRLESLVKIHNTNGLNDINGLSEDFFCKLLNLVFKLNLINLNELDLNFPAIDLGDSDARVSFQVTSEKKKAKIDKTIKKFNDHKLSERFDSLRFMLIVSRRTASKSKFTSPDNIDFDQDRDIYDLSRLTTIIRSLDDIDKIKEICSFLRKEFDSQKDRAPEATLANEIETIADLVVFLSTNKSNETKQWLEEPDPENKIEHRFSEYSQFLRDQIVDLLPRYSLARSEVDNTLGLDSVKINFIRNFLRIKSDIFLTQTNGDPKKAIDMLTEYFSECLNKSGKKYDYQAIRFYVLDELIKCNVFPN
ncbi:MAG: SMEK domain-containing protein [Candidatus Paceibacterota bacterium]